MGDRELTEMERKVCDILLRRNCASAETQTRALSEEGLIVTPLHERALQACKRYAKSPPMLSDCGIAEIGREALAAEKPKIDLQWFIVGMNSKGYGKPAEYWEVIHGERTRRYGPFETSLQASAVAEAMNATDRELGK